MNETQKEVDLGRYVLIVLTQESEDKTIKN